MFVAFEIKASRKRSNVSELQSHHLAKIVKNGGYAFVVTSLKEVEAIVEKLPTNYHTLR